MILHVWKNALIHAEKCAAPTTTSGRCRRTSWREKQGTKRTRLERSLQGRECRQKKPDRIPEWQRDQFVSGSVSSVREAELSTKLSIVCCIKAWRTACRSSKEKETKKEVVLPSEADGAFFFLVLSRHVIGEKAHLLKDLHQKSQKKTRLPCGILRVTCNQSRGIFVFWIAKE